MIGGGYTWEDIYIEAANRNMIAVGGGTPVRWHCLHSAGHFA